MLRKLFLLCVMAVSAQMWAYDALIDGIYYNLDASKHEAEVTYMSAEFPWGIGEMVYSPFTINSNYSGTVEIPSQVTYQGTTYDVTSIGLCAFARSDELEYVKIPSSVQYIGLAAFTDCTSLISVYIPEGVEYVVNQTFDGCSALESVHLPSTITYIGVNAFFNCKKLKTITLPEGLTYIGSSAFNGCTFPTIALPSTLKELGSNAFSYSSIQSMVIPNGCTTIGEGVFNNCASLVSVTLPEGLTSIPTSTFANCRSLQHFNIPSTVTSIGAFAFANITTLKEIDVPEGVVSIGYSCFSESGLTSISLPSTLKELSGTAFLNCTALESVELKGTETFYYDNSFYGCNSLKSLLIPGGTVVWDLGPMENLEQLTFGKDVKQIGDLNLGQYAKLKSIVIDAQNPIYDSRDNCNAIIETATNTLRYGCNFSTIPTGVEVIGERAMASVTNWTELDLPHTIKSIESKAFAGLTNLNEVRMRRYTPPTLAEDAFPNYNAMLTVYYGTMETYEAAPAWKNFNMIFPGLEYIIESITLEQNAFNIKYGESCKIKVASWYPDRDDFSPSILEMSVSDPSVVRVLSGGEGQLLGVNEGQCTVTLGLYQDFGESITVKANIAVSGDGTVLPPPVEVKRCADPVITFTDGKIEATCSTPSSKCVFSYQIGGITGTGTSATEPEITLVIKAQAQAPGYESSPVVTKKLYLNGGRECDGDVNGDTKVSISDVNALIQKLLEK